MLSPAAELCTGGKAPARPVARRGRPPSNDAAKTHLLTPQQRPAAFEAVLLRSAAVARSYCRAAPALLTKGCINVTEGSFSSLSAIV